MIYAPANVPPADKDTETLAEIKRRETVRRWTLYRLPRTAYICTRVASPVLEWKKPTEI
jgi:hypothetical protein